MDPVSSVPAASDAYAAASHATVFASVACSFVGLGWALALMLRPKTCSMCVWSMALFSLAWLVESTTHLLGVGGHVEADLLRYGVWTAVVLFGGGLVVGVLGVLAYLRNEHRYERGLVVGVFATLLNLWVVGGIVMDLRNNRTVRLGRGLVFPVMESGGAIDEQALAGNRPVSPDQQASAEALELTARLGRVVSDLALALSGGNGPGWEVASESADSDRDGSRAALRVLHPRSQHVLACSTEPGWMSLALTGAPVMADPAAELAERSDKLLMDNLLSMMPQRRLRAVRTHVAGFEVIRTSTHASIKGVAGALVFDRWVAVAGKHAVEVVACTPDETPAFFEATRAVVVGVLRKLQRDGLAGPALSEEAQHQLEKASSLERAERFVDALPAWHRAAVAFPLNAEAFLGVLRCSWKLGQSKDAVAWMDATGMPVPESVATSVGALRLRAASGQLEARDALSKRFEAGLADDEALASLLLAFASRHDKAGALQVLAAHGDRHADSLVAWWQAYLAEPPTTAPAVSTASAAAASTAAPPVDPVATKNRSAESPRTKRPASHRSR